MSSEHKDVNFIRTGNYMLDKIFSGGISVDDINKITCICGPSIEPKTFVHLYLNERSCKMEMKTSFKKIKKLIDN